MSCRRGGVTAPVLQGVSTSVPSGFENVRCDLKYAIRCTRIVQADMGYLVEVLHRTRALTPDDHRRRLS